MISHGLRVRGEVAAVDERGVATLTFHGVPVQVKTVGEPPAGIVGRVVELLDTALAVRPISSGTSPTS